MTKPNRKQTEPKGDVIQVVLRIDEIDDLKDRAAQSGHTVSSYVRHLIQKDAKWKTEGSKR